MTRRYLAAVAAVAVVALLVPLPAAGQASTPWGDPDLQGIWDHRTLTPLERPDQLAGKEVFTEEEAAQFQAEQLSDIEGRDDAAERFVRSIKEECLSRVVPLGEGHLRLLVGEYVDHDHRERNHQGLDNQLLQRPPPPVSLAADVQRRERLGGLLNFYHREAA